MNEKKDTVTYRVEDHELLLGFYKKLCWDRLVPRIPASITPNTLTIIGQVLAVLGAVACGAATFGYPILYLVSAILFLAYLTFDNIDGPHARRTGQTSPLGEFLDHGLDGMASASLLVATAFMLQLDGMMMALLCAMAAFGFAIVFWEQFRTGLLVIPKVSTTEGVTLLALCLTAIAIAGEPTWMRFSLSDITPGTILVLAVIIGYLAACVPPIVRAWRKGVRPWELVPVVALVSVQVGFAALGATAVIPAAAAGLIGADVTCRIIVLRHRGASGPVLSPLSWLATVPLVIAAAAPNAWTPNGWAGISLAVVVLGYGTILWRGTTELLARAESTRSIGA
ncbi:MAG: CDP-alcohol phosphatidyltransferase family protein [Myxococcota bacterium]